MQQSTRTSRTGWCHPGRGSAASKSSRGWFCNSWSSTARERHWIRDCTSTDIALEFLPTSGASCGLGGAKRFRSKWRFGFVHHDCTGTLCKKRSYQKDLAADVGMARRWVSQVHFCYVCPRSDDAVSRGAIRYPALGRARALSGPLGVAVAGGCVLGLATCCKDISCTLGSSWAPPLRQALCLFAWWCLRESSEACPGSECISPKWFISWKRLCWAWFCWPPGERCYWVRRDAWASQDANCDERGFVGCWQYACPMGSCFNEQCHCQSTLAPLAVWWWHGGTSFWRTGHPAATQLAARHWVTWMAKARPCGSRILYYITLRNINKHT